VVQPLSSSSLLFVFEQKSDQIFDLFRDVITLYPNKKKVLISLNYKAHSLFGKLKGLFKEHFSVACEVCYVIIS
jgi:mRNA-degrading endonuclease YafQ of YafQ-DinJ toxin-antitoxin module